MQICILCGLDSKDSFASRIKAGGAVLVVMVTFASIVEFSDFTADLLSEQCDSPTRREVQDHCLRNKSKANPQSVRSPMPCLGRALPPVSEAPGLRNASAKTPSMGTRILLIPVQ